MINKWFLIHTREWDSRWHLGLDHVYIQDNFISLIVIVFWLVSKCVLTCNSYYVCLLLYKWESFMLGYSRLCLYQYFPKGKFKPKCDWVVVSPENWYTLSNLYLLIPQFGMKCKLRSRYISRIQKMGETKNTLLTTSY